MIILVMVTIHNDILHINITDLCDRFVSWRSQVQIRARKPAILTSFVLFLTFSSHTPRLGYNCIHYHPTI